MRKITENFIYHLKGGKLIELLERVKQDDTLDLQIREDYVSIYYRGGSLIKVTDNKKDSFKFEFNQAYLTEEHSDELQSLPENEIGVEECKAWINRIPFMKNCMDLWFAKHPKLEREMQQMVIRENNHCSISTGTDFFIADMEYAGSEDVKKGGYRFDMIGIRWIAEVSDRKKYYSLIPCFLEMKYGDGAFDGTAGLDKHFEDMNDFLGNDIAVNKIYDEIESVLTQKQKLGLFKGIKAFKDRGQEPTVKLNRDVKPYYILLLANTNPRSDRLNKALSAASASSLAQLKNVAEVRSARASCMGYGLYEEYLEEI